MSRQYRRRALLIGNESYRAYHPLPCIQADITLMSEVLSQHDIGGFTEVRSLVNGTSAQMVTAIADFLGSCVDDELALLYFTGHGKRLVQVNSEFHFITTDTDPDDLAGTAVRAGFVADRLMDCVAAQKVVIIDSCESGGFSLGFRTAEAPSETTTKGAESPTLLYSRGTYVLSSSRATEESHAETPIGQEIPPSVFTREIVDALRSGNAAELNTGEVTVDDLAKYVNAQLRQHARQISVTSANQVDDRIVIAKRPKGVPTLTPVTRQPPTPPDSSAADVAKSTPPTWSQLFGYYRNCLRTKQGPLPLLLGADEGTAYVCLTGREQLLSGDVDTDHRIAVPRDAQSLVQSSLENNDELWAGYPAVVLTEPGGRRGRQRHTFAPLLVRRVEIVQSEAGTRLEPVGRVIAHPALIDACLGEGAATDFNNAYLPGWHAGEHALMAKEIGLILRNELEVSCIQALHPDRLERQIDFDTAAEGARNAAVLFRVPLRSDPEGGLHDDLDRIEQKAEHIRHTALAALSPDPRERTDTVGGTADFDVVTPLPCNDAQAEVIRSAMSRRLTIATGPPGTGKSQLVTNLIATAIANGQRVLIASTNNKAVDEVWERCERLCPSSLIRTGNKSYNNQRDESLRTLLKYEPPQINLATATMRLRDSAAAWAGERTRIGRAAALESHLLDAGRVRESTAAALGTDAATLATLFTARADRLLPPAEKLTRTARRVARAWFLPELRQRRLLAKWGLHPDGMSAREGCLALAEFAHAHQDWQCASRERAALPDDDALDAAVAATESALRDTATALLDTSVRALAGHRPQVILDLLEDGSRWPTVRAALQAVPAWAVSALSAQRFPPDPTLFDLVVIDEASQCSIPHVLPLLFRARRALIIGDPMQLPPIATLTPDQEAQAARDAGVGLAWLEHHRMSYRKHSSYRAAERAAGPPLLLDEHFRCHPRIAELVNELFYDGRLVVMTDTRDRMSMAGRDPIIWTDVRGDVVRPDDGESWLNPTEVDKVASSVEYLHRPGVLPDGATVGVITPFKAQATAIRRRLGPEFEHVAIGTVHTFQGGECDVIVFSLVAAPNMPLGSIDWIDKQLNLWNVAITRARSHLVVFGDRDLWSTRRVGSALLDAIDDVAGSAPGTVGFDDVRERLHRYLTVNNPGVPIEVDVRVLGHRTDAVIGWSERQRTAVVLDRGVNDADDAARHLKLTLAQRAVREAPSQGLRAVRIPAWRLYQLPTDHDPDRQPRSPAQSNP
ncbi:AAA domain-containing protein [Nocardia otitidiscaviarum]|uniref:AAA domain-containing protein n=1 Tax=Nocardia otitidiscaviarum TaxID=1823 RepID=UPI00245504F3|nr:AAA domain-containing protein [Nocardia otitidiscaviarum]